MPKAYPGIREILERHKRQGGILAVVSHSMKDAIVRDYRENGLPQRDAIYGWDLPPEQRKPNPWPLERIMEGCERHCEGHARLRMNLLRESAQKFWQMRRRVTYLSEPSLRRRVLLYLQDCRSRQGSDCFRLSLSREEMAAYLAVNRSALSRELSRLQQEGLIEFYRNSFRLHFSPEQLSVTEM